MSGSYVMAYDLGSSSVKSILLDSEAKTIASTKEEFQLEFLRDGWAETNPLNWWQKICRVTGILLKQSGINKKDVGGIIFDSAACGLTPMGDDGQPLRKTISWLDSRATEVAEYVMGQYGGRDAFLKETGNVFCGKDTIMKILWLMQQENDIYSKTKFFLDDAGYILFMATGEYVCSVPNASAISLDYEKRQWDYSFISALGLDGEKFPRFVECNDVVGPLTEKAAGDMGLLPGIPVFGGCTDMIGIEVGSGCTKPGDSYFYLGTSGLIGVISQSKPRYSAYGVPLASYKPGNISIFATSEVAGGCIDWAVETLFKAEKETMGAGVLGYANEQLRNTEVGADGLFFTNWLYGERNPIMDEYARGTFVNLSIRHSRDHMLRAVYEGVAYQMAWIVEELEREYDLSMKRLRASGGGSRSANWMQIMADATGRPVDVVLEPDLVVARGTGCIALMGLGLLNLDDVGNIARVSLSYEPDEKNNSFYREGKERYKEIYGSLKNLFGGLNRK